MQLNARDLCKMSKDDVWALPDDIQFTLQFDDGEIVTDARTTIFSWYCMVFNRYFPEAPVLKEHHICDDRMGGRTHLDLLGRGLFNVVDFYRGKGWVPPNMEDLTRIVYQTTNEIYNDFTYRLEAYVTSVSILDFIDVVKHPVIEKANNEVQPTKASIGNVYKVIGRVLKDPNELHGNPVAKAAKSGLVSMGQIQQCVGPRGFLTGIDSVEFSEPILTGYVHGIKTLYASMIESRSASKALEFAKDPVAESEYFNRKMQLGCATLQRLHREDCGTQVGMDFKIKSTDFDSVVGKFYRVEGGWKPIREKDRFLVGTTQHLRVATKCKHPDPYGVCAVCFGELADSVPDDTNLGHVSATVVCEEVSQNVLSTKHLDGSSMIDEIRLSEYDQQYLRVGTDPNTLILSPDLEGCKVVMTIPADANVRLSDINKAQEIRGLVLNRISELREVRLTVTRDGCEDTVTLPVSMGSRLSSLTHEALFYIKYNNWTLTDKGDYQIDLSAIDPQEPLFSMPPKQINMVEFMGSIEFFVRSSKKTKANRHLKTLKDYPTPEEGLLGLYELVSSKLKVNLAHLEIIVRSMMIRDASTYDHRMPGPEDVGEIGSYEDNMRLQSLSKTMAYQKQESALFDIRSYTVPNRSDHPQDRVLMGR